MFFFSFQMITTNQKSLEEQFTVRIGTYYQTFEGGTSSYKSTLRSGMLGFSLFSQLLKALFFQHVSISVMSIHSCSSYHMVESFFYIRVREIGVLFLFCFSLTLSCACLSAGRDRGDRSGAAPASLSAGEHLTHM